MTRRSLLPHRQIILAIHCCTLPASSLQHAPAGASMQQSGNATTQAGMMRPDHTLPGCKGQGSRVNVVSQQLAFPRPLRLLRQLADFTVGLCIIVVPALEGKLLPEQAWGSVGGHQGGFYQKGPGAAHGVCQGGACRDAQQGDGHLHVLPRASCARQASAHASVIPAQRHSAPGSKRIAIGTQDQGHASA